MIANLKTYVVSMVHHGRKLDVWLAAIDDDSAWLKVQGLFPSACLTAWRLKA